MKKTMFALLAVMIVSVLAIGSVLAVQYGNRDNTQPAIDKATAEAAVESGNYTAWKALHQNSNGKMVSLVNESNFYLLKQMHDAKEAGDLAKVAEIRAELGFKNGNQGIGMHNGLGKGKHNGQGKNGNNGNCPYAI